MGRPAQKRRKLNTSATEEVVFNYDERKEYLNGFHKRKVQRAKAAQEAAAQKARSEKIADRKKLREERRIEMERHVEEVNAMLERNGAYVSDDEYADIDEVYDWDSSDGVATEAVDHEAEYVDEDKYTTVKVEEVDISKDGISKPRGESSSDSEQSDSKDQAKAVKEKREVSKGTSGKKVGDRDKNSKRKKRSFRYESPAERKLNRVKARAKNSKQARMRRGE